GSLNMQRLPLISWQTLSAIQRVCRENAPLKAVARTRKMPMRYRATPLSTSAVADFHLIADRRPVIVSVFVVFSALAQAVRAGQSARLASQLHRSSCRDAAASRVFSSFDQLWIGDALAVCGCEQRIDAIPFLCVAT